MVDWDNSGTLTFDEFKEFMISQSRQKLFNDLMRKEREQQIEAYLEPNNADMKKILANKMEYLPLSADTMIRHLRHRTIRKALYNEIFNENKNQGEKKYPINSIYIYNDSNTTREKGDEKQTKIDKFNFEGKCIRKFNFTWWFFSQKLCLLK